MAGGQAQGKAYLDSVLSKITDPGLRDQAAQVFANAVVQTEIGNGVAGQSEIDRQLQELRTKQTDLATQKTELDDRETRLQAWHGELTEWGEKNKEMLVLGRKAKEKGFDPTKPNAPAGDPTKLPENVITKEAFENTLKQEFGGVLSFAVDQNSLMIEHYDKFGRMLDIQPLITHPQIRELGLKGVYQLVHKDALEAKAKEVADAAEAKIRADERQKVMAAHAQMPYPSPTGSGSGSPLDSLSKAGESPVVDAAVAEYNRLTAARAGA